MAKKDSDVIKPMLAGKIEGEIQFPTFASPKLDGIRCIVSNSVAMSRNWKPIPNRHVQKLIGKPEFNGFDGELGVGNPGAPDFYRATMHGVMSEDGEPDFIFWIFDYIPYNAPFSQRVNKINQMVSHGDIHYPANVVEQRLIHTQEELNAYEADMLGEGYEGLIIRHPEGPYKHGRSTPREGWMLKLKRFSDAEAEVIGTQELMKNGNEATKNAFGRTERSSHKANMIPQGTLGAILCKTTEGIEFAIGTGFDADTRAQLWEIREDLPGKFVKYKFFDGGNKDAPRFPVFIGFRDPRDM
jgi:DNA ligase 1